MKSNTLHPDCEDSYAVQNSSFKNFSQRRILKNLIVLCTGVLLLFIAYDGLTMLQSTMNREHGIGVISQVVNNICFCTSAVLFPKYVIKKIGRKATLVISMIMFLPYVASNFYPHWGTLIPSSICLGFGSALYWGTQAIYLNDLSAMYADAVFRNKNVLDKTDSINCDNRLSNALPENCSVNPKQTRAFLSNYINYNRKRGKTGNNIMLQSFKFKSPNRNSTENVNQPNFSDMANNEEYSKETNLPYHNYNSIRMGHYAVGNTEKTSVTLKNERNLKTEGQPPVIKQPQSRERKLIESTTALFFGIHGTAYLSCFLWSNLLSYYVLQSGIAEDYVSNTSCPCGANYCNIESACYEHNIAEPSNKLRYILTGTCVCVGIASVLLVLFFLDSLETHKEEVSFSIELLKATYKQARRKELIFLMPSSFYVGMVFGFYSAEYNKSFVACAWGIFHVGLVATSYGTFCGIASLSAGWLVKRVGRIPIFFSATIVNIATNIFFLLWKPSADEPALFFVGAGLWGLFVGVFWSQLRAFYGVLFKADEEAAFAVFHVWFPLGFALSFGYSAYFCTSVKIYLMMIICTVGFIGYVTVEILYRKNKAKKLIT
ncbi:UNC93-like protein [Trichonephila inaurata madagascariensis]|uniref:UNC93-like protein n=1 Tax=Trichonephila inaurata madagascariensis TaxID=2747483 RepID=A0A8X7CSB1_9ARAC|nr:UNC93-like protein [Trichonephila inaurata madagascariensis]